MPFMNGFWRTRKTTIGGIDATGAPSMRDRRSGPGRRCGASRDRPARPGRRAAAAAVTGTCSRRRDRWRRDCNGGDQPRHVPSHIRRGRRNIRHRMAGLPHNDPSPTAAALTTTSTDPRRPPPSARATRSRPDAAHDRRPRLPAGGGVI
jgi:hypothetical protein